MWLRAIATAIMPHFVWWKALLVVWARIFTMMAAYTICLSTTAAYVIGLNDRPTPTFAQKALTLLVAANPGFFGVLAVVVFFSPGLVVALFHYLAAWLLRFLASRWPIPTILNSLWEGCLSMLVFWSGFVVSFLFLLPFMPWRGESPPTEAEMQPLSGFAVLIMVASWNLIFFLELGARHTTATTASPPVTTAPTAPTRPTSPTPVTLRPTAPPDPLDTELERMKRKAAAKQRQSAIASANEWEMAAKKSPATPRRQAKPETTNPAPPKEDPFGDANF